MSGGLPLPYTREQLHGAVAGLFQHEIAIGTSPRRAKRWTQLTQAERQQYIERAEGILRASYGLP